MPKHLHTSSNPPALEKGRAGKESARKEESKWADLPFAALLPNGSEEGECVHCWVNTLINSHRARERERERSFHSALPQYPPVYIRTWKAATLPQTNMLINESIKQERVHTTSRYSVKTPGRCVRFSLRLGPMLNCSGPRPCSSKVTEFFFFFFMHLKMWAQKKQTFISIL